MFKWVTDMFGSMLGIGSSSSATVTSFTSSIDGSSSYVTEDDYDDFAFDSDSDGFSINPANGLPMMGGIDIEGNAYGTDSSFDFSDDFMSSSMDDGFSSDLFSSDF